MPHGMGPDIHDTIQVRDRLIAVLAVALRADVRTAVMSCADLGVTWEAVQREAECDYHAGQVIEGEVVERGVDKLDNFDLHGFLWARSEYERQGG